MLEIIIGIIIIIVIGVSMISILYSFKRKRLQQEREYLQMQQILLQEHYEVLERKIELTNQYRKDIEKHMEMVKDILSDSKREFSDKYQEEIEQDMAYLDTKQYSSNLVVNSVFVHKIEEAKNKGIKITVQEDSFACSFIKDIELVGIFYNLFDNAIEACCNIKITNNNFKTATNQPRRWLTVTCKNINSGEDLYISFKNSKNSELQLKDGRKTWKKNQKEHGIGLEVLAEIVKKNKGKVEKKEGEDWYQTEIWLKSEEI